MWQYSDLKHKEADYKGERRRKFIRKKCKDMALLYIANRYINQYYHTNRKQPLKSTVVDTNKNKYVFLAGIPFSLCDE